MIKGDARHMAELRLRCRCEKCMNLDLIDFRISEALLHSNREDEEDQESTDV